MEATGKLLPLIAAMAVLVGCSAFFSACEAALFSLRGSERRSLETGSRGDRVAAKLLRNPDRLLSSVLFWNLVVNIVYFAIATVVSLNWHNRTLSWSFAVGSLLVIIFFSEMLPKSIAVLQARSLVGKISIPLAAAIRFVDPIMPGLQTVNLLARRLIWPGLAEEPYLAIRDLERAIGVTSSSTELIEAEQTVLANVVKLSDLRVQEWMRPRTQLRAFRPPVAIDDLGTDLPPSGYVIVTEPDGDEIASAISLDDIAESEPEHLEKLSRPVVFVPWCASVSDALSEIHHHSADVAAVVNEFGETIGIITIEDVFDALLTKPDRSERLLRRNPITQIDAVTWHIGSMMNLSRLAREFETELPSSRSVTLGGVVQETLESLPTVGDVCHWGPFEITVLDADNQGDMMLRVVWVGEELMS